MIKKILAPLLIVLYSSQIFPADLHFGVISAVREKIKELKGKIEREEGEIIRRIAWKMVSCGGYHTVAIRVDGTLWAWGDNDYGQLGLGDKIDRTRPTQVGTATDWAYVSCGWEHTLAIKKDGTLWAWGRTSMAN